MQIRPEFKLEDFWIGFFWKATERLPNLKQYDLWICILPCLPLHITWRKITKHDRK